jgi:hypothetical protein
MNKNQFTVTVKAQNGNTWPNAIFNVHQRVRHVIEAAVKELHLDASRTYEVLLSGQRSLPLDASFEDAGVRDGDLLLIRTIGHTIDGELACTGTMSRR